MHLKAMTPMVHSQMRCRELQWKHYQNHGAVTAQPLHCDFISLWKVMQLYTNHKQHRCMRTRAMWSWLNIKGTQWHYTHTHTHTRWQQSNKNVIKQVQDVKKRAPTILLCETGIKEAWVTKGSGGQHGVTSMRCQSRLVGCWQHAGCGRCIQHPLFSTGLT